MWGRSPNCQEGSESGSEPSTGGRASRQLSQCSRGFGSVTTGVCWRVCCELVPTALGSCYTQQASAEQNE
jgi:hypothetical protein